MRSCHSAPRWPDTSRANPRSAQRPSGAVCVPGASWHAWRPPHPHRFCVCADRSDASQPSVDLWGCHSPCPNTSAGALSCSAPVAPRRLPRWFAPAVSYRGRWLHQWSRQEDRRAHRRANCVLCRFSRDPWGSDRHDPPKTRLGHSAIGALPVPVDAAEVFAFFDQHGHDLLHDVVLVPALEPIMDRALSTKPRRQLIPLAAAAHAKNDAVENLSPVGDFATRGLFRPELYQDRSNAFPQIVRDFPDGAERRHRLTFSLLGHPCPSLV